MYPVLFTSQRPIDRAENINALFNSYTGEKEFIRLNWYREAPEVISGRYKLMVTDEIPAMSPGSVIMIGHGIAGTKFYGLDQPRPYETRANAALITYAITQSPELVDQVAGQLGVTSDKVLPLGMPRTDEYIGKIKGDGGTGLNYDKIYFYAPTYRTKSEQSTARIDYDIIDNMLTDNEVLVVKPHMLTPGLLNKTYRHIIEVSSAEPSTPYLIDSDVVITDFSSIMLDGLAIKKPVVLFSKENSYLNTRGMYFKYPDKYSDYYADNEIKLINILHKAKWTDADEKRARFFVPTCNGGSCERVIKLIQEVNV